MLLSKIANFNNDRGVGKEVELGEIVKEGEEKDIEDEDAVVQGAMREGWLEHDEPIREFYHDSIKDISVINLLAN